jgi:1-pyrroline-5-carboxylate dehydrogenase
MALNDVANDLGKKYPLVINGEKVFTDEVITSVNPANKEEVIGTVSKANKDLAEQAMQAADKTFQTWRKTKAEVRANILFRAAAIVRRRKHYFSAILVKEAGKPWNEADADTAEAIDFMEYYARQMLKLDGMPVESRPIEQCLQLCSTWCRCHHLTLEFPVCDHGRHDDSSPCFR